MNNIQLESVLNELLSPHQIKDYCPNGLQVEGKSEVKKIITGVTACQALIDRAISEQADALLVHHGFFWKGEPAEIRGMKYRRIKALIENGINLYAYHLPLDVHPTLGNNAKLAELLDIEVLGGLEEGNPNSVAIYGQLAQPLSGEELAARLSITLHREPLHISDNAPQEIKTVGWCTGGGQDFIELAANKGLDAFISGEISERTVHISRELGIHYFSAGHHATERYGIKSLGDYLAEKNNLDVEFIDIDNPV
ncbi:Nif3-like dinuclear metal center hexameric protein [Photobacterium sp. DNB23_23_1]|uniref:Nif3-like dinuclear metal center hexameric protein n=1 Tax=Photobacterium pectinilyticum TaxID=2906793 RepID=A0ABT1MVT4_9GAMM|nr:Nif3-like dinuclear metal center hexameric protein [Photobacterium sp. ZSDE20]MCQ1056575.1 Nif3-like dinuclear metal center hexameric protein [Photobacterium sp. ZSDE20]MDD1820710.1 Nif3-like dinuclear metal center hexameric protein [Photobacterium sp. ZSDE20]